MNKNRSILLAIILGGFFLRVIGLNWDQNYHLHPDERFLTMVGNAMKIPGSFIQYLNPSESTMNPVNIGFPFYVYGVFPVVFNKVLAVVMGNDSYNLFTLQGRFITALLDTISILFVYLISLRFEKRYGLNRGVKYFSAFFYAISVLPIQLAHFYTADPFLNFFCLSSVYFALKKNTVYLSAIMFGLALSSKVTAVFITPLIGAILLDTFSKNKKLVLNLFFFSAISYATVRIGSPYIFETGNIFNPTISGHYLGNLNQLKSFDNPDVWFPPSVQWINTIPFLYSFSNLSLYGLGPVQFLFLSIGYFITFRKHLKTFLGLIAGWSLVFFLYQSFQFSKPMRYMYILYPYFAILSGIGFSWIRTRVSRHIAYIILFISLLWPLAFISIYMYPHSRISASEWIYRNVPAKSIILTEHWDDSLPVAMLEAYEKQYVIQELPVFATDTPEKIATIEAMMKTADYYILSSNRGWGSITKVAEHYPYMSKLYERLFQNKTDYKFIKEFNSFPSYRYLGLPIEIPDRWVDESSTVYDHPVVLIFKNQK